LHILATLLDEPESKDTDGGKSEGQVDGHSQEPDPGGEERAHTQDIEEFTVGGPPPISGSILMQFTTGDPEDARAD
jgi:hypothetical protein